MPRTPASKAPPARKPATKRAASHSAPSSEAPKREARATTKESLPVRAPRGRGRPTELTAAVQAAIVASIEQGSPLTSAAAAADVSIATVTQWMARGRGNHARSAEPIYVEFVRSVEAAQERTIGVALNKLFEAAKASGDVRAIEAWLRLMYPHRFSRRITIERGEVLSAAEAVLAELGVEGADAEDIIARAETILGNAVGR